MTTASKLTLLRIVMIPFFMFFLLTGHPIIALVIFIVASLTDFVDGYIARHYNQVSDFGKFLDPLADKLWCFQPCSFSYSLEECRPGRSWPY